MQGTVFIWQKQLVKIEIKLSLWLEDAIFSARDEMINNLDDKSQSLKYHKIIKDLELAHSDLKNTNVNARLALENLFLNI